MSKPYLMNDKSRPQPFLTQWYPATTKPVRDGRYQVKLAPDWHVVLLEWKGGKWRVETWPYRSNEPLLLRYWPKMQWRGLAQDPKG